MTLAPKIDSENTYFIFRDNGWEVEFTIVGELIRCSKKLHPEEVTFIRENLIKKITHERQRNEFSQKDNVGFRERS